MLQGFAIDDLGNLFFDVVEVFVCRAAEFDQKRCGPGSGSSRYSGVPGMVWAGGHERRATINSTASAPSATSSGTSWVASAIDGNTSHEMVVRAGASRVS